MQFRYKDYDGKLHYVDEHTDNVKIIKTDKYVTIDWGYDARIGRNNIEKHKLIGPYTFVYQKNKYYGDITADLLMSECERMGDFQRLTEKIIYKNTG